MKKIILYSFLIALISAACDMKEEYVVEKSKVVDAAGEWYVYYDHNVYGHDPFGVGLTAIITYNTADDVNNAMWLSDEEHFWDYTVKIPVNVDNLTFGGNDTVVNAVDGYPINVLVRNGQIFEDAVVMPESGATTDSIYFEIWFQDLDGATGIESDTLFVAGFRRTGFLEDEPN